MRLNRKQFIADLPVKTVRDFLRKYDSFSLDTICKRLCLSQIQAHELIKNLKSMELIETDPLHEDNGSFWRTTIKGNSFRFAKFLKPLEREKALRAVDSLLILCWSVWRKLIKMIVLGAL